MTEAVDLREKVARVIDPEAFVESGRGSHASRNWPTSRIAAQARNDALTKADAILNLIGGDGWKPASTLPPRPTDETWRILAHCPKARTAVRELTRHQDYEGGEWVWSTPHGMSGRGYIVLPEEIADWMPLPALPLTLPRPHHDKG